MGLRLWTPPLLQFRGTPGLGSRHTLFLCLQKPCLAVCWSPYQTLSVVVGYLLVPLMGPKGSTRGRGADGRPGLRGERVQGKRKGKWREASRHRPLQTATHPCVMPNPPPLRGVLSTGLRCKLACETHWRLHRQSERRGGGGGVGTRPWWLALLACGGAYWPLALEPSAMTSRHPYYCGHPHCPWGGGIQNATSAHGVLP